MRLALLIAFTLTGCIPPQQPGYYPPPQQGNGAPPPQQTASAPSAPAASCQDTLSCYTQCNPVTDACVGSCDQRTTPDSQQNAHAVLQCMVQSGCQDQNCIAQQCGTQITTCTNQTLATTTTAAPPAPPSNSGGCEQEMKPEYSYGSLYVPPPQCTLTQADFTGSWDSGTGTGESYYDSSGNYAGSTTISTADAWVIDAQGNYREHWVGATTSSGAALAKGTSEDNTGTFVVTGNNIVAMSENPSQYHKDVKVTYYLVVGWFVGPSEVTMTLHGPFYQPLTQKDFDDAKANSYMDKKYHRKR